MKFSSEQRSKIIKKMESEQFDVLVIGGGITGAGIALDAITRGLKVALVEMQDFAAGTSSRSTKLVHGGLRYLKNFEIKIVAEVGKERAIVYENGPHVTTPEWMMLPFHAGGTFGPFTTNAGLRVYDYLAGVKKKERRKMLSPGEAAAKEPLIRKDGLKGAGYYVEYRTDDARLTIEVLKKAVQKGAFAINYAKVQELVSRPDGKIAGVHIEDMNTGRLHEIHAKKVINAAGPWVDKVRGLDEQVHGKRLQLTKGVHLVFSLKDFPLRQAIYFDAPDKRMIFAIPREGKTYVGTTDTVYDGDIQHPQTLKEDRDYLLNAIHYMFPDVKVGPEHVESSWAGLRPLIADEGKKPGEISRKEEIFISKSGLISMAGGKLTGYRKMAEIAVNEVVKQLKDEEGILYSESETEHMPIAGGEVGGSKGFARYRTRKLEEMAALGISKEMAEYVLSLYGANTDHVLELYLKGKDSAKYANLDPLVYAMLVYGIEEEMVSRPIDFLVRRTAGVYFHMEWAKQQKEPVIQYMKQRFGWTKEWTERLTEEVDSEIIEAEKAAADMLD
ncbi:glycerol-3-phosphate dehydrogenase/oxidase [Aciduricibacillus chroicocephali]|uniref:Glycerol-3-phosphate dehydrogenase n=1 Tax=Aciduricibacillus chroicocephali TaxID=3054939 RepID=A0ABY9KT28_9BACI|nr:glycerol-3-phosphate dehydrogenase/oxidase [Bacillaceae bacterium 44XB]